MKHSPFFTAAAAAAMAVVFTFCGSSSENDKKTGGEVNRTELITAEAEAVEAGCDTTEECARARFKMPMLRGGDPKVTERINSDVEAVVREHIKSRLPEPMAMGTFSDLAEAFVEGYTLFAAEFPDNPAKWFFEIDGDSSAVGEEYFTLRLRFDEYMGGAHPNSFTLLQTYRLSDGELVDVRDAVDEDDLRERAEAAFRQKYELEAGQSLNDAGFMFEDGVFILPENMALTEDGILLIYNPYEVASYDLGYTVLRLPLEAKPAA